MKYLDEFVIGQENAKKVLSVACVFPLMIDFGSQVDRAAVCSTITIEYAPTSLLPRISQTRRGGT